MGVRHLMVMLGVGVYVVSYITRIDLSNSIVKITSNNTDANMRFEWSEKTKSFLLACFFGGYVWLQIPAGYLSDVYGPKLVVAVSILIIGATKLVTPVAIFTFDWLGLAACRIIEGMLQGTILPALTPFIGRWVTTSERSYYGQLMLGGIPLGSTIGLFVSGPLLSTQYSWPLFYYVEAAICLFCFIIWMLLTTNSPQDHWLISEEEKEHIVQSISKTTKMDRTGIKIPWLSMMTSMPVIALLFTHTARNFGYWLFFTNTPRYMSGVGRTSIRDTGFYSSLPYILSCFAVILFVFINLFIQRKNLLSISLRRKIWITISFGGQIVSALILIITKTRNLVIIMTALCISNFTNVAIYSGTLANQTDLSPNFGGTLMALTTFTGTLSGLVGPIIVGIIVKDQSSVFQWSIIFTIVAIISALGNIVYVCYGSAEVQPWNDPDYEKKNTEQEE